MNCFEFGKHGKQIKQDSQHSKLVRAMAPLIQHMQIITEYFSSASLMQKRIRIRTQSAQ
jgi:hypothetical protein